jgi:CRP-like cAMP-binding protein
MPFLIQENEGVRSAVLPLCRAVLLVGRDPDSNLYLDDTGVSKNHASIFFTDDSYVLRDNGSTNGSIVNGVKVGEHKLAHGDLIQFGPYRFKVDLKSPVPVTTAVPENEVSLERAGRSFTRRMELEEIAGVEKNGPLRVVLSNPPKPLPPPLPPTGFLKDLTSEQRQNLSKRGQYRYARIGEVLIQEGVNSERLLLLISGKWEARNEATKTVFGQIQPSEWVGEVSIFDPVGAVCSVVAVDPSEYWEITRDEFEKFINESRGTGTAILIALATLLGRRIRQSTEGLNQAIQSLSEPQPARGSRLWPVFATLVVLAAVIAAFFFFSQTADKKRLVAENEQLERTRAGTLQEAHQQIDSLQKSLKAAKADLGKALADKKGLANKLTVLQNALKSANQAKAPVQTPKSKPVVSAPAPAPSKPAATPAQDEISAKAAALSGYPSEVLLTKKTTVQLLVDGRVSGSVVMPEGRVLRVVGAEEQDVIVEFGDARHRIPKENTNFAEALVAEAEAAKNKPLPQEKISKPEPKLPPAEVKTVEAPKPPGFADKKPIEVNFESLTAIVEGVNLLESLDQMRSLKTASNSEIGRFMRPLEGKWKRASEEAAQMLSIADAKEEYKSLLRKFIEASEMLNPNRLLMFEAKLKEIDQEWLALKTQQKIQNLTESPGGEQAPR